MLELLYRRRADNQCIRTITEVKAAGDMPTQKELDFWERRRENSKRNYHS